MTAPRALLIACVLLALGLVALIVWSSLEMSLAAGLRDIVGTRWGITTMVDLYGGLGLIAAWIAWRERRAARAIPWIIGLALLGNLAALVYVAFAAVRAQSLEGVIMRRPPVGAARPGAA